MKAETILRDKLEKETGAAVPTAGDDFIYADGPAAFAAAVAACRGLLAPDAG